MRKLVCTALIAVLAVLVLPAPRAHAQPAQAQERKFEYTIDTMGAPDLKDWAETLRPEIDKWYPRIVEYLPSDGYSAPKSFTITFKKVDGVAYTSGTAVVGAEAWFKAHPDDRGAIIHELVHVVQQYHSRRNPGWLVEGVADYIRWIKYEPANKRPHPNPARAKYTDSYRTTAAFLEYVAANYDHEIAVHLNEAMREGRYRPELWTEYTGKSADDLGAEWLKSLAPKP
ncbi:MAG TPA: basic secretory protein-like protein [Chthonomonadaceae bacterium]|nr:basic secretory protein-like protein [Chthonomonadaceae bacterium]